MTAATATNRINKTAIAKLANLKQELDGSAPVDIAGKVDTTLTLVFTTETGAITLDVAYTEGQGG